MSYNLAINEWGKEETDAITEYAFDEKHTIGKDVKNYRDAGIRGRPLYLQARGIC